MKERDMAAQVQSVTSWGRLWAMPHQCVALDDPATASRYIGHSSLPGLAFGMGRSYGDVGLNPHGTLWQTSGMNRFVAFDAATGDLRCEAGVLLRDIQRVFVPQGWMLPVTPGTQIVTVGGAIANDVHGKNHHVQGSFGHHVQSFTLVRTDGQVLECSRERTPQWFAATVGGMGLTGVVTEATIRLRRVAGPWLQAQTVPYAGLDEFFRLAHDSEQDWEHTVSWIDCLSSQQRGLFMRARPLQQARPDVPLPPPRERRLPFTPPFSLVNGLSLKPFNEMYYRLNARKAQAGIGIVHYEPYSYPLDGLLEWNRMYGPKGFYQYQSAIPAAHAQAATHAMLQEIARSGSGSFLAVLKTFGPQASLGMLGFPLPGATTLALDFPNHDTPTLALLERLDAIVREAEGRIYPAKDARMSRALFQAGYPRLPEFLPLRDPGIGSSLSRRLID